MKIVAAVTGIIALAFGIVILATLLIKLMWGWTVPDLFPGAVETGLIAAHISWWSAFKLAFLVGLLASGSRSSTSTS